MTHITRIAIAAASLASLITIAIAGSYNPGDVFRDCPDCPEMVVIAAGKFTMGSPEGKGDKDEHPQHDVTIDKPFAVGKFEVTWDEWQACVADKACNTDVQEDAGGDNGWGRGRRPVIEINWHDATAYAAWLTKKTGKTYRLLTEAEWEYVARAGAATTYSWGDDIGKGNASCAGCGSEWDDKQTAPVGSFKANQWGVHDMHGNVWEWTQDCYQKSYDGAPVDGSAVSAPDCNKRIVRGGAWYVGTRHLRAANRSWIDPEGRNHIVGFRVARSLQTSE